MTQITLKKLAEKADVSTSTASRVLSGKARAYRISTETADRVRKLAKELKYEPNQLAKSLRLKQTYTIGVIIPDISNPFFSAIARSVEIESRKAGYTVIICDSREETAIERESLKILITRKVDGILISPVGNESAHIEEITKAHIPIVTVDRYFPKLNIPSVVSDNFTGAFNAVENFIQNGHRKIAFIQGIPESSVNKERLRGYRDAHIKNNIPINESYIVGDNFGEKNGYICTKILLNASERPTAIFAGSNLISLGVLSAIKEENFQIPDDISVIAFDDQPYSRFLPTPMTTVRQKKEELGKLSINLLINQINNQNSESNQKIIVPTELILRNSVKKLLDGIKIE